MKMMRAGIEQQHISDTHVRISTTITRKNSDYLKKYCMQNKLSMSYAINDIVLKYIEDDILVDKISKQKIYKMDTLTKNKYKTCLTIEYDLKVKLIYVAAKKKKSYSALINIILADFLTKNIGRPPDIFNNFIK